MREISYWRCQELFTSAFPIVGSHLAHTTVSKKSIRITTVLNYCSINATESSSHSSFNKQTRCIGYHKTEHTHISRYLCCNSFMLIPKQLRLITKQLRAKSTPGTRSSLGVSRIATQVEEDKCQTLYMDSSRIKEPRIKD